MSGKASRRRRKRRHELIDDFLRAGITSCPICEVHLTHENSTIEHVPPKKISKHSNPSCITCRECNNRFGRVYESVMDRAKRGVGRLAMRDDESKILQSGEYEFITNDSEHAYSLMWRNIYVSPTFRGWNDIKMISIEDTESNNTVVQKGWIKSLYLMAGCASNGVAWNSKWSKYIRNYLTDSSEQLPPGTIFNKTELDIKDGIVWEVDYDEPVYVVVWGHQVCIFGVPKDIYEEEWSRHGMTLRRFKEGPIVYGQGEWKISGENMA